MLEEVDTNINTYELSSVDTTDKQDFNLSIRGAYAQICYLRVALAQFLL